MNGSYFTVGSIEDESGETMVVFRQRIADADRKRLPMQFVVEWQFNELQPDGFPAAGELEDALVLQRDMLQRMESKGESLLALVAMGNGFREWYFYCRDPARLQAKFNTVVAGRSLPVSLHAGRDPEWETYRRFTERIAASSRETKQLKTTPGPVPATKSGHSVQASGD